MSMKRPEPSETPTRKQPGSRPSSADRPSSTPEAGPSGVQKLSQPMYGSQGSAVDRMYDSKPVMEGVDDRELREQQALREKQNENHQILKENIELKSQMDRGRQEMDLNRQKQEENRRITFYQQKQIQQHWSAEKRKMEMLGKPPELKSGTSSSSLSAMDSARLGSLPPGAMKPEDIKKEPADHSRLKDSSRASDTKGSEEKRLGSDKGRSAGGLTDTPKSKSQDQAGVGPPAVSSIGSSNPPPAPPGQYAPYPYPVIPSPYGPMQMDPGHPMYRQMGPHMIGYATAGPPAAYIHPSQLGYRMGPPHLEGDKEGGKGEAKASGPPPLASEDGGKAGSEGSQQQFYLSLIHISEPTRR